MKDIYVAMAAFAGLLFVMGDTIWKYKFHGSDISFLNLIRFWTLPAGILIAMIITYSLGGIAKLVTLYPLKEAELSAFIPMIIVFTVIFSTISGIMIFREELAAKKAVGILLAIFTIYLLR